MKERGREKNKERVSAREPERAFETLNFLKSPCKQKLIGLRREFSTP